MDYIVLDFLYWGFIIFLIVIIFYYKTIRLYQYTVGCFQNIVEDERLQRLYMIKINGTPQNNIRLTVLNIMYMYVIIPSSVTIDLHLEYLKDHLKYVEEALSVQNLYGLVKSEKRRFLIDGENISEEDKKDVIYLIKFKPIFQGLTIKKFVLCIITICFVIYLLNYFGLGSTSEIIFMLKK